MNRLLYLLAASLSLAVGCDGIPGPAQYDQAMLREYFGKSPAEVEAAFGKPSKVTRAELLSPPEDATPEEQAAFKQSTTTMMQTYSTPDGELVFEFNLNDVVANITYAGETVTPLAADD